MSQKDRVTLDFREIDLVLGIGGKAWERRDKRPSVTTLLE